MKVKFRTWYKALPPRPIKLQIPGWAGNHKNHNNGSTAQPWHCIPFVEGSTYGLELIYPFDTETKVYNDGEKLVFDGDFSKECVWSTPATPPFAAFSENHYGFTSSLDIKAPENHIVRIEPHPRFFTDITGTCPIAVPGHIHPWWSRIFFVVFKSPLKDQVHIFKKNEPYAQILILPQKTHYEIESMSEEEIKKRISFEEKLSNNSELLSNNNWIDNKGNKFNDKYKCLLSIVNKEGCEALEKHVDKICCKRNIKVLGKYVKKNKKF